MRDRRIALRALKAKRSPSGLCIPMDNLCRVSAPHPEIRGEARGDVVQLPFKTAVDKGEQAGRSHDGLRCRVGKQQ